MSFLLTQSTALRLLIRKQPVLFPNQDCLTICRGTGKHISVYIKKKIIEKTEIKTKKLGDFKTKFNWKRVGSTHTMNNEVVVTSFSNMK